MVVFFWWRVGVEGGTKGFTNTKTKEPVCEAESVWIHLRRAEQACWQENTSGEGQPSTLWLCWRQWHNSNTCRAQASSFLNLLSLSLSLSFCGRPQLKPDMELDSSKNWEIQQQQEWSHVRMKTAQNHMAFIYSFSRHKGEWQIHKSLGTCSQRVTFHCGEDTWDITYSMETD